MFKYELLKTIVTKYYRLEFNASSGESISKVIDNHSLDTFVSGVEKMLLNKEDDEFFSFYIDDENYLDVYYNVGTKVLTIEEYNMPVYSDFNYSLSCSVDLSLDDTLSLINYIKSILSE